MGRPVAYAICVTAIPRALAVLAGVVLVRRPGQAAAGGSAVAVSVAASAWVVFFGAATASAIRDLVQPWPAWRITSPGQVFADSLKESALQGPI